MRGESGSANPKLAAKNLLPEVFQKFHTNKIHNMDELAFLWKQMPRTGFFPDHTRPHQGHKPSKERVTIGLCVSADGSHKTRPMVRKTP